MDLDTNEGILREAKEIAESEGRDLRKWLYREVLLNALRTKMDERDILDLQVVSRTLRSAERGVGSECRTRVSPYQ